MCAASATRRTILASSEGGCTRSLLDCTARPRWLTQWSSVDPEGYSWVPVKPSGGEHVFSQVMYVKTLSVVGAAVAVLTVSACSNNVSESSEVNVAASATVAADQETALRDSAEKLDKLAATGNAEAA